MTERTNQITWSNLHTAEFKKPYFKKLKAFLKCELKTGHSIYPAQQNFFKAFEQCPFEKTKVILLGQDPYHGEGQAQGLSFSVPTNGKVPPSLQNIFKELENDLNLSPPSHGNLETWARQGVLLLNSTLSVRAQEPASHTAQGWETFTDTLIKQLSDNRTQVVFCLWGKFAQSKEALIDPSKHLILKAAHPSPFSAHRGFFGSKPFSQTNAYLIKHGQTPINWQLE